jgi:general secretion pathway protein D
VPLQVLIEATIAEVTLNDELKYGLQYFLKSGQKQFSLTNGGALNALSGVFPGFNFVLGGSRAQAILSALTSISDVNVISSPQLLVLDHHTAALQVGDQVPIVSQTAVSTLTTGAPVVNSVEYRDTGVILQVTPRVNSNGLVTLDISQEVSDVATTTSSSINSPTIQQRKFVSSVVVRDGETIALGGLIKDTRTNTKSGIPFLSQLPVAGGLFSNTDNAKARTELIVLLSPKVIRNDKEAQDMTDELRSRMHAIRPIGLKLH